MSVRLASFDVFDSTLIRDVLVPSDLFRRVAHRILPLLGQDANFSEEDFVQFRVQAELRARAASREDEISLEEIWTEWCAMVGCATRPEFAAAELDEEEAALCPVLVTRRLIEQARKRYGHVAFSTDTYLPQAFVESQLRRHGMLCEGDHLYVSSELRKTKSRGTLFEHLLRAEALSAAQLAHYGDNPHSDIAVPLRLGITAHLISAPKLTECELALLATPLESSRLVRDIAAASRCTRLAASNDARGSAELIGAFLGPFCTLFAAWALRCAQARGIERLYFLSRDGQLTWHAARLLAPNFGGVDCRYLLASRQALLLPSILSADRSEFQWLRRPFEQPLLGRILAKLELDEGTFASAFKGIGRKTSQGVALEGDEDWDALLDRLCGPPLRDAILSRAAMRRTAAAAYFKDQGLFDQATVGIVDLGWFLTCQTALRQILVASGHSGKLEGFYLQLNCGRVAPSLAGRAHAVFHQPPSDLGRTIHFDGVGRYASFLEHVVGMADHPRVSGYMLKDARGGVEYANGPPAASMAAIHDSLRHYVQDHHAALTSHRTSDGEMEFIFRRLIEAFHEHASAAVVDSLRDVHVSGDQNDSDAVRLAQSMSWREAIRPSMPSTVFGERGAAPLEPWPRAKRVMTPPLRNFVYDAACASARLRRWLRRRVRTT